MPARGSLFLLFVALFTVTQISQGATPFPGAGGDYGGVIEASSEPDSSGIVTAALNDKGAASLSLIWKNQTYRFKGTFVPDSTAGQGSLTKVLAQKGVDGVELVLTSALDTAARVIDGSLAERPIGGSPGTPAPFSLSGAQPDEALGAEIAGETRVSFIDPPASPVPGEPSPIPGDGFTVVKVASTAKRAGRFVGRLPDSQPYSAGSPLRGATYAVRSGLYKTAKRPAGGQILGKANVASGGSALATMLAELRWHKKPNVPQTTAYTSGFDNRLFLDAYEYPKGQRMVPIGLQNTPNNATIRFRAGNIGSDISIPMTITIFGARMSAPNLHQVKVQVNAQAGKFSGSFRHPLSVGSSRVDLQACKLEYSIVSPK